MTASKTTRTEEARLLRPDIRAAVTTTKREQAVALLRGLFAHRDRITITEARAAAADLGISPRTLTRAAHEDLGMREIHNGRYPGIWELEAR
jgi:hypothetical protein